jgi:hypothetical protein
MQLYGKESREWQSHGAAARFGSKKTQRTRRDSTANRYAFAADINEFT